MYDYSPYYPNPYTPRYQVRMLLSNPPYDYFGRRNRRAQACDRCGEMIGDGAGLLVRDQGAGNRWAVLHYSCAPPELQQQAAADFGHGPAAPKVFTFDIHEGKLLIRQPAQRLSDDEFAAMRSIAGDCCQNTRIDGQWVALAPLDRAAEIQDAYEAAGFSVAVTDTLQSALSDYQQRQEAALSSAVERAANINEILAQVGIEQTGSPFSLYPYQSAGIQWLASRDRALLADDQGLGKTIQSCTAIPDGAPAVIVAPVSLMLNWEREMARWRPERAAGIKILGSEKGVKKADSFKRWPEPGETFITTYSRLPKKLPSQPGPGTYLICDEAHNLKTLRISGGAPKKGSSQRAAAFWQMSQAVLRNGGAVWLLTGTPLMNRPNELWSVLQQANLQNDAFGSWRRFVDVFNVPASGYQGALEWDLAEPGPEVPELLQRVMLRREKEDALTDLPPKTYQTIEVPISTEFTAELDPIYERVMRALEREEARGRDVSEDIAILEAQKAAAQKEREGEKLSKDEARILNETKGSPPGFEEISKAREILARAKIPALLEVVRPYEEQGEPVLVFSAHLKPLHELAARPGWAIIEGKTKPAERQKIVDAFQAGQLKGIAASIRAAGVGITLTRSNTAIFLDKDWTPAGNVQAEDRIHRIGQFRPVQIVSLVADHAIDQRVNGLLENKARIIKDSISAGKRGANEFVSEPIRLVESTPMVEVPVEAFDPVQAGLVAGPADPEQALARAIRDRARAEQEERERRERERWQPTAAQLAETDRRLPETPDERWIMESLAYLSAADLDFAKYQNDAGFSKAHSSLGHQMSNLLQMGLGLTEDEWKAARETAIYHKAQLPPRPSSTDPELAELEKAKRRATNRRRRSKAAQDKEGGIELGAWVTLPGGREAVVVGRGRKQKGKPILWKLQVRGGDKLSMTAAQIRGEPEVTAPAPAARTRRKKKASKKKASKRQAAAAPAETMNLRLTERFLVVQRPGDELRVIDADSDAWSYTRTPQGLMPDHLVAHYANLRDAQEHVWQVKEAAMFPEDEDEGPPPPPMGPPPLPPGGPTQGDQMTLWNPPWRRPLSAWPSV